MTRDSRWAGRSRRLGAAIAVAAVTLTACGGARDAGSGGGGEEESFTIKFSHVVTPDDPEGSGRGEVQGDRRGAVRGAHHRRDLPQLRALRRQGRAAGPAVRRRADARARRAPSSRPSRRSCRCSTCRSCSTASRTSRTSSSPDTAAGKAIFENEALASKNIKVLDLWDNGLKQLSSNQEMTAPDDLKGLRFRIQPSDVLREPVRRVGRRSRRRWRSPRSTTRSSRASSTARRTRTPTSSRRTCTRCRSSSPSRTTATSATCLVINQEFFDGLPEDLQERRRRRRAGVRGVQPRGRREDQRGGQADDRGRRHHDDHDAHARAAPGLQGRRRAVGVGEARRRHRPGPHRRPAR